ncbi:MAG: protein-L-isoaspartate(D-aspartate) O-methyltransferase [Chloroflexota bacterium]
MARDGMGNTHNWSRLEAELRKEGVTDTKVLKAMSNVPRDLFVLPEHNAHAWQNIPLPIGEGQTISQPLVVGLMTQALGLQGAEKVLEIGTGSGYQCAILALLSRRVISIERLENLATLARARLAQLGYGNAQVVVGDGTQGYPEEAPFDAVIVTAATQQVPKALLEQLAEGGRLIAPVGSHTSQELLLYIKQGAEFTTKRLGVVRFVPLIGESGWKEREADILFREQI